MQITLRTSTINTQASAKREIKYIVIHYTAGTTSRSGTAINTANYFQTAKNVSADFIVDDATIVQYNPDIKNRYCWHCGGAKYNNKGGAFFGKCTNANSIGIEICCNNSTRKMQNANDKSYSFTEAALNNALFLINKLMLEYNIPKENVIRHYDVNGKPCPGIIGWNAESGSECEWFNFKAKIQNAKSTETKSDKLFTVQVGAFATKENAEKFLKEVQKNYPNAFIKENKNA